jgi:signal peptidase I
VGSWREASLVRRARKEARVRVREVRGILREYPFRVPEPVRLAIAATCDGLDKARAAGDHEAIAAGLVKLDEQARDHLGFAGKSTIREYAESIGVAVLIALFLRAFVVEAFKIPSGSMIPTMEVGDHIFVNKFVYGVRLPFTKIRFFEWRKPQRGEVIVFIYPVKPEQDFIKRVVAVEGDRVQVRNNQVFINGRPVPRQLLPGPCNYWDVNESNPDVDWSYEPCTAYRETMGEHTFTSIADSSHNADFPRPGDPSPYIVPKDHVFVMGDNRSHSSDSRFWGPVPIENIKGKALVIWYSRAYSGEKRFMDVRWDRLGDSVD